MRIVKVVKVSSLSRNLRVFIGCVLTFKAFVALVIIHLTKGVNPSLCWLTLDPSKMTAVTREFLWAGALH